MTKNEKRLVLNGIFLPVILAIILSVLFVGSVDILESNNSFIIKKKTELLQNHLFKSLRLIQ